MKQVDVIINLPIRSFNSLYSYSIPAPLEPEVEPGKRVLVELNNKQIVGYIAALPQDSLREEIKPIIKVLDPEPILNQKQIELARWMADVYLCPLAKAINLMVPGLLNKPLKRTFLPALNREDYLQLPPERQTKSYQQILEILWQQGETSWEEIESQAEVFVLHQMVEAGLLIPAGTYSSPRQVRRHLYYQVSQDIDYEDAMKDLKRAPRQLQALKLLIDEGPLPCSALEQLVSPVSIKKLVEKGLINIVPAPGHTQKRPYPLNEEQKLVLEKINSKIQQNKYGKVMLYGITGSGKTEIYMAAAEEAIAAGRTAMVLVPEIALTRHLVRVFSQRFEHMAVLHSGMSGSERFMQWQSLKQGRIDLVLGTRSAVFAPLEKIGLIVIDEEQGNTYKQEETPKYHAREVADFIARQHNAVLVLGSATPSIESFHQAIQGEMDLLTLDERAGEAVLPEVTVVDLKEAYKTGHNMISGVLQTKIEQNLSRGEQTILFLNRRGYTPVTICMECGTVARCPRCSVALNYHRDINRNVCHYCNYQTAVLTHCPSCNSKKLQRSGVGTQKVEELVSELFPQARVMRLDLDSSRRKGDQENILKLMREQKIDILVGTQMVAKGLDFPGVSLVGVVDADSMLNLPDFRAAERCFQLIVQAAGRAGRGHIPGEVIIQTFNPDSPVIQMASRQDYFAFYLSEIGFRKLLHYPPFTNLLRVVASSTEEDAARMGCEKIAAYIREITDANEEYLELLGPAPCPLAKIKNRHRYQLIIKCDSLLLITSIAEYIIYSEAPVKARVEVEINPLTIL